MTTKTALFALLAMWGVGASVPSVAFGEDTSDTPSETQQDQSPAKRSFTNRVWVKAESGDLPGVTKIFLSDGTLVQDSCWEGHRLSQWQMTSDTALQWDEDGMPVKAAIISVTAADLVISINGGAEERYVSATVPYVCPDMPKA